jgi:hypothetical protein
MSIKSANLLINGNSITNTCHIDNSQKYRIFLHKTVYFSFDTSLSF